jgi:hypothetical protein
LLDWRPFELNWSLRAYMAEYLKFDFENYCVYPLLIRYNPNDILIFWEIIGLKGILLKLWNGLDDSFFGGSKAEYENIVAVFDFKLRKSGIWIEWIGNFYFG